MNTPRIKVDSSNLKEVGYDHHKRELKVVFHSYPGRLYTFYNVPARVYKELMEAESIGSYFARNIRNRYHSFAKTPLRYKKTNGTT